MLRCVVTAALAAVLSLPGLAAAQVQRAFPADSLRGDIAFIDAPDVALNRQPARLSPAARIRDGNNFLVVTNAVAGQRYIVNYTLDTYGLINHVWVLRPEEIKTLWPRTREEAAKMEFDPAAQTWTPRAN
jgi:hypothetical protein